MAAVRNKMMTSWKDVHEARKSAVSSTRPSAIQAITAVVETASGDEGEEELRSW
jgi:hypothetical protein